MSALLKDPMSVEAFLEWNSRQEAWYEFDGQGPLPMNGGTISDGLIQVNLLVALAAAVGTGPFHVLGAGTGILAGRGVRYPDALIAPAGLPGDDRIAANPLIVFEILSPTTASIDRIDKNQEYRDTPSIQRYVILEQDRVAATVFARQGNDWAGHVIIGDTDLPLPEAGASIRLRDLYRGIALLDHANNG
jgi:Uma2 family endonuclease